MVQDFAGAGIFRCLIMAMHGWRRYRVGGWGLVFVSHSTGEDDDSMISSRTFVIPRTDQNTSHPTDGSSEIVGVGSPAAPRAAGGHRGGGAMASF
jgi:hypothetical protein